LRWRRLRKRGRERGKERVRQRVTMVVPTELGKDSVFTETRSNLQELLPRSVEHQRERGGGGEEGLKNVGAVSTTINA